MNDIFFFSRSVIRQDLLCLFFTNQSTRYYLRQLSKTLGHSAGSLQRELAIFEKAGLIKSERLANLRYYALDKNYEFYKEVRTIVTKTVGFEGRIKRAFISLKGILAAFVFDAFAVSPNAQANEIDIFIAGTPDQFWLKKTVESLEKRLGKSIRLTIMTKEEIRTATGKLERSLQDLEKGQKIMLVGTAVEFKRLIDPQHEFDF